MSKTATEEAVVKKISKNEEVKKNGLEAVPPTEEVNYDIVQSDIDGLAQVFSLARQSSVNNEANLQALIVFKQQLTEKLNRLIKK